MKYLKYFEGINAENIDLENMSIRHEYNKSFGHFYEKIIGGKRILIRIDRSGSFGYNVDGSPDIEDNNLSMTERLKIINFVKNILFYHLTVFKPEKIYIHGTDFNDKKRIKKDDVYKSFLSKIKVPDEYEIVTEFTIHGDQNVIKLK